MCLGSDIDDGSPSDRDVFLQLGLFFNENLGFESTPGYKGTKRFHTTASVIDGMPNTLMLAENIRTGYDPNTPYSNWASIDSRRTKFFFSHHVCKDNVCVAVGINLSLANHGDHAINSGKTQAAGDLQNETENLPPF